MSYENTSETIISPSNLCENGFNITTRLHKYSPLTFRKNVGQSESGISFECDGLDLCLVDEDIDNLEIEDYEACRCGGNHSGFRRVRDESGQIKGQINKAPETWCVESSSQSTAGNGPAAEAARDILLIDGITLNIKSKCIPLVVRPRIEICGWKFYPDNVKAVSGYVEHTITRTNDDDSTQELEKKRCHVAEPYGGGGSQNMGCWEIPKHTDLEIKADVGLQYHEPVESNFQNNLSDVKIVADVTESPSFNSITEEDC